MVSISREHEKNATNVQEMEDLDSNSQRWIQTPQQIGRGKDAQVLDDIVIGFDCK
jgi:hypothetical protein